MKQSNHLILYNFLICKFVSWHVLDVVPEPMEKQRVAKATGVVRPEAAIE
jgi:hypothetical protein